MRYSIVFMPYANDYPYCVVDQDGIGCGYYINEHDAEEGLARLLADD